jgi:hypothetical protein
VTDDDQEPVTNSARYRCVISRDGSVWVGRTYGTYMPEESAEARSSSLEDLKDEAQGRAPVTVALPPAGSFEIEGGVDGGC